MFAKLLKYSLRSLLKQRSFVIINVIGLSIALVCCIIITLFIFYELSYDQYNEKKDRVYRVILNGKMGGQELSVTSTASIIGPTMLNEFPEVESFLRLNGWSETIVNYEENYFTEDAFLEADSSFFEFFSIPLLSGDPEQVLAEPYYAVLSESAASKIFGDEDPLGKLIRIGNEETHYKVTGIMADIPANTHFSANIIGSFMTNPRADEIEWLSNSFNTYVLLKPNSLPEDVDARFAPMIEKYVGPLVSAFFGITLEEFFEAGNKYRMYLQPLGDIHLDPSIQQDLKAASDPRYLWIFGSVAILIIVIAAVNFMNLATAQAMKRAKEIGIKKVCGSTQFRLISQFLLETLILSLAALILAVIMVKFTLPYFNNLLDMQLELNLIENWYTIPLLILLCVCIAFLAGLYPAFYLSSFNPNEVLKGKLRSGSGNGNLRRALVVIQFSISLILIIGTMIMFRQMNFMLNKELGFDKEQVFVISRASALDDKANSFKEELLQINGVMAVSASTTVPGHNNNNNGYGMKGRSEESFLLQTNWADPDFLKTYGIPLASGRYFTDGARSDERGCIINETAVKHYSLGDPFSESFILGGGDSLEYTYIPVIGVVQDFHHESLRMPISPYIIRFKGENTNWGYISIRLAKGISYDVKDDIEKVWSSFTGGVPMQSFFMDSDVERMYREEKRNGQLSILFAIIGIIIAALGLYGLTSYAIAQRTREIGIRKTFGATVSDIWYLFTRETILLILIACAIALPLVWWVGDDWLQNYHYRIHVSAAEFIIGFILVVLIALFTISYRIIKTALDNPTESLRYE